GIKENERAIKNFKGEMTKAIFGIHASFTLSNQTLRKCSEIGKGSGYHIHVAEDMEDVKRSIKNYGMRPVKRLKKYGILGNRTIAAHCIHVNDNDIAILSKTRTNVIHNPESNMNNAVGSMPILKFIGTNACTGLGTDGFTFDMFREMKFAYLLHKHVNRDPRVMDVKKCVEIGIKNNSEIASKFFKRKIGKIEKGAYADLILIDYQPRTPMTSENIYSHIIFGIDCRNVDTTIINGKILMENKKMNIGKEELYAKARECARKLWGRLDEEKPKY
ncbi:MAG: amidohydrolase family protein, partial [Candidatus Thermoplasmatota archaeon]